MKYKLLQNLPWAEAWEKFSISWWSMMMRIWDASLDTKLLKNRTWFEPIEEPKEWASNGMYVWEWKQYCEEFYKMWKYIDVCVERYDIEEWISFRQKEEAQLFADKLKALKTIWKFKTESDWDFEPDWTDSIQVKYLVSYSEIRGLYANLEHLNHDIPFMPWFSSEEITEEAIERCYGEYITLLTK